MRWYSKLLGLVLATGIATADAQTLGPPGGGSGGSAITALTGDCTATGPGSAAIACTKTGGVAFGPAATALVGQIPGTATNDNATAGKVGEYQTATASNVSLVSGTAKTIATVSLTAGDWDCNGQNSFINSATISVVQSGIGQTTNTLPSPGDPSLQTFTGLTTTSNFYELAGTVQELLSGTTNVFLIAESAFTIGTVAVTGTIRCRRIR